MGSLSALLVTLLCAGTSAGLQYNDKLTAYPQGVLQSYIPSDNYLFGLDIQGRLFLDGAFPVTYFADGGPNSTLVQQGDGNLVLYKANGDVAFASGTDGNHGARLDLDDGPGFAKIISIDGSLLAEFRPEGCVGRILQANEKLHPGEHVCYAGNRFGLRADGRIENYSWGNARTYGDQDGPADYMIQQSDGNLVAYRSGSPVWSSGTHGNPGSALYAADYGNAVTIFDTGGNAIWRTGVICTEFYGGLSDEELWARATNGNRIGKYCYILGPTKEGSNPGCCACNYYVKGRPSGSHSGVPLTTNGEGTGCVKDDGGSFCYYNNPSYDLTDYERLQMCSSNVVSNAAAQLRYGAWNGNCEDEGVELSCP